MYKLSSFQSFMFYLLTLMSLLGCGGGSSSPASGVSLDTLSINSLPSSLKVSETFQLVVTANYSDATTKDISSQINWVVSDSSIVSISNSGLITALSAGTSVITASLEGVSVQGSIKVIALTDLSISPVPQTLAINTTQQLSVTGRYSDNTIEDFSHSVTWVSSDPAIATVSVSGEVQAKSAGIVDITARSDAISQSISMTVLPDLVSLSLSSVPRALKVAETFQLSVMGHYSDNSSQDLSHLVDWGVSDASIVSISDTGLLTALAGGISDFTVFYGGLSNQQSVSVKVLSKLNISPNSLTLAINSTQLLSVTGLYTDNSTEDFTHLVSWGTANAGIASVSNAGEVSANAAGLTTISASVDGISAELQTVVSPATLESILVSAPVTQIAAGLSVAFSAKGVYSDGSEQSISHDVVWSIANPSVATIDAETGLLNAIQTGEVVVLATKGDNSGTYVLTVTNKILQELSISPSAISLAKGTSSNISVTAIFSDNSKQNVSDQVVWNNTDNTLATIGQNGLSVNGLAEGIAILTASLSGQTADLSVNITSAVLESLVISPANTSIPLGFNAQFTAQGNYTDGSVQDVSAQVTWLSSDESVAVISNAEAYKGLASSVALGLSTITAVLDDVQQQTALTIEDAELTSIDIQPANQVIAKGTDAQLRAYGYYSDGSKIDLTTQVIWNRSNASIVDLSSISQGIVHSLNEGSVLLSAELLGISGIANIEVSSAMLQSIVIESVKTDIPKGMNQQLVAKGNYSDTSTKDITKQVTWQSADSSVLTVANDIHESGLLRANSLGQSLVTASLGQVSGQINVEVTDAILLGLEILSSSLQLNVKSTEEVSAIATYSDSSTQNVTKQVNWLSNNLSIASVGNDITNKGKVSAIAEGNVAISASLNTVVSNELAFVISLNPNTPRALNMGVQPNVILNNSSDISQVHLALIPTGQDGLIPDGTPVHLTITEGNTTRTENLATLDGAVTYQLQSDYDGFISLSASSGELVTSSGLVSTNNLANAIARQGRTSASYENNTLRAGSKFLVLLRNLSNRVFGIEQINIFYVDPNNGNAITSLLAEPIVDDAYTSNGSLIGGELTFIGYELDSDVEASIFGIQYHFSDAESNTDFPLSAIFNYAQ